MGVGTGIVDGCCSGKCSAGVALAMRLVFLYLYYKQPIRGRKVYRDICTGGGYLHRNLQLKIYVLSIFISNSEYKQEVIKDEIIDASKRKQKTWEVAMLHYEVFIDGKISKETFREIQEIANISTATLNGFIASKAAYKEHIAGSAGCLM